MNKFLCFSDLIADIARVSAGPFDSVQSVPSHERLLPCAGMEPALAAEPRRGKKRLAAWYFLVYLSESSFQNIISDQPITATSQ